MEKENHSDFVATGQYGKDMPVAYGESERLLGKVFSLAGDNLEAIVQEINPLPFSILKPWILIQIESFHNSMSRRPSLRTHHGALETRGNFHFFTFSICSTKLPFRDPCSLVAEEKASSSDNENSPATKGGEFQKRICDKGTMKEKRGKPVVASDRPGKGDKLPKHNIHHSDGAKYMSYLKISKKQHQLVKSLQVSLSLLS